MTRLTLLPALLALGLLACGTSSSPDDGDADDSADSNDTGDSDDSVDGDSGDDADDGIEPDGAPVTIDPADCDAFAANAVAAQEACGGPLPGNAEAALAAACKRGLAKAELCGGDPEGGMACFREQDPSDWVCQLGTALPSCDSDIESALGAYCLVKLGDPSCASIACESSLDCPTGASCNDATGQCFSTNANCVGLPCDSSLDCPTGEICNSAEHACVRN